MATALRKPASSPPLDQQSLANIQALESKSSPNLLGLLIDIYLEDTLGIVNELRSAVLTANTHAIRHLAHRLKGSSANFGARALMATCEELEKLGGSGSVRGAFETFQHLEKEYTRVRRALEQIRSSNGIR